MTISSTTRIAGPFTGNGVTTTFPFTYKVFSTADVQVIRLTISTGIETTLTIVTDYTITLNGDQDSNPGGNIVLVTPLLALYTLTATSDIANLQPTDLTNQGGFYPEVITDALDRATIQIQQISDIGDRTLKIPISDGLLNMELPPTAQRINTILGFGAAGLPTVVVPQASSISGNTVIVGTLGVTSATALSTTLGVTGATTLSSTLGVTGATTLSSTLGVTGATTLSSTLGVTGATTLSSTLGVTGNLAVNTNKFTVAALSGDTLAAGTFTATGGVVAASLTSKIQPITASIGSSALTITLDPTILDFRNSTLTSGTVTSLVVANAISLTIPSTSTMGTTSAVQSRIVVLAINNAGTVELAAVNIAGGSPLDETTLITTTAAVAAGNSATAYYSTAVATSVAYRVVGYIESTQATAGTWATAPSTIQGMGGQALTAMSSLGYGQTWQSVTSSRALSTFYYNTTGKPILISVTATNAVGQQIIYINGVTVTDVYSSATTYSTGTAIIPVWGYYNVQGIAFTRWLELR